MTIVIINSSHVPEDKFEANLIVDDYKDPVLFSFIKELYESD
jgi:hypothetical protein